MVVPLDNISDGRHYVKIAILDKEESKADTDNDESSVGFEISDEILVDRKVYIIPFYLEKN